MRAAPLAVLPSVMESRRKRKEKEVLIGAEDIYSYRRMWTDLLCVWCRGVAPRSVHGR
jgi:hypothetical protein